MQIVTNGKFFRLQEDSKEFVQTYFCAFGSGKGSWEPWQTTSYIKALKRYGAIMKARANKVAESKWERVQ